MSTGKANRSSRRAGQWAAGLALFAAALLAYGPSDAGPTRTDLQRRQEMMDNSAGAANDRTLQQRDIADKQRQLLEYQVRKNRRMQQRMQCKAAGGGLSC